MFRRVMPLLALLLAFPSNKVIAAEIVRSDQETEFFKICERFDEDFAKFGESLQEITSEAEVRRLINENDPASKHADAFIQFETRNRGTHIGLMALRHLLVLSESGGDSRDRGRQYALRTLRHYADSPVLTDLMRTCDCGNIEPMCLDALRDVWSSDSASATNIAFAKYQFARCVFNYVDARNSFGSRFAELENGVPPRFEGEEEVCSGMLLRIPPAERLATLMREAMQLSEEVSGFSEDLKLPAIDSSQEDKGRIVFLDAKATLSRPSIKDMAKGLLFREKCLAIGKQVDNFELETLDGKQWKLSSNGSSVAVIQFSFKGCGPCETMYPFLRKLKEEHGSKVNILTVLVDKELANAKDATESGKITWNAHWDGPRGPMCTLWSVESYPAVYVMDAERTVRAIGLRGDELVTKVEELLVNDARTNSSADDATSDK